MTHPIVRHIAINMVLPKLYAMSLMYTLNIRNELRSEHSASNGISIGRRSYPHMSVYQRRSIDLVEFHNPLK
jgi:hypothetical protein